MVKRKLLIFALLVAGTMTASAQAEQQPQVVPGMNWDSNWFVEGQVGLSSFVGRPMGCHDIFGHVQPLFKVSAGKWITPSIGLRATGEGYSLVAANMRKQHYQNYHFDVLYSIFGKPECPNENNRWGLSPYLGVGFLHNESWGDMPFGFTYGVQGSYRINDRLRVVAELSGTTTTKSFDGLGASKGYGDTFVNLSLGVSYTLGETCWRTIGGKAVAKKEKKAKEPKPEKPKKEKKQKKSKREQDQDSEIAALIAEIAMLQDQLKPCVETHETDAVNEASPACVQQIAGVCAAVANCASQAKRAACPAYAPAPCTAQPIEGIAPQGTPDVTVAASQGISNPTPLCVQPSANARLSTASEPVTILVPQGSADVVVQVSQNGTLPAGQLNGVSLRNNQSRTTEPVKVLVPQGSNEVVARIIQGGSAQDNIEEYTGYVYFEIGSAELDDDALDEIERLADEAVRTGAKIRVVGSADSATGSYQINKQLAKKRAQAVARVFRSYGVRNVNIQVRSVGGSSEFEDIPENRNCKIELYK